jgi:hypothetical protein
MGKKGGEGKSHGIIDVVPNIAKIKSAQHPGLRPEVVALTGSWETLSLRERK